MLGNGIPGAALTNALPDPLADVMMNWWGSHNLFGMWLTPMLLMTVYYMVPQHHQHAAVQPHAVAHLLLGHRVHLHQRRRAPPDAGAHPHLGQDLRHRLQRPAADTGLRLRRQHLADDAGQLGEVRQQPAVALLHHGVRLLLPGQPPGHVPGDPGLQPHDPLHQLDHLPRPPVAARRHDHRGERDHTTTPSPDISRGRSTATPLWYGSTG